MRSRAGLLAQHHRTHQRQATRSDPYGGLDRVLQRRATLHREPLAAEHLVRQPVPLVVHDLEAKPRGIGGHRPVAEEVQVVAEVPVEHVVALRSEEHTSELQSLMRSSYAVFCLKKKKNTIT